MFVKDISVALVSAGWKDVKMWFNKLRFNGRWIPEELQ